MPIIILLVGCTFRRDDMNQIEMDKIRYGGDKMPHFQYFFRKAQQGGFLKPLNKLLFIYYREKNCIDLSVECKIGGGLYLGHATCITINPHAVIGHNCNIHKGVTIGRENRGKRMGTPTIGDNVWIGINAVIVGAVKIGNDVMIAPNAFVNFDVPDHSIVIGNPGVIKHQQNATEGYINNSVDFSSK